MNELAAGKYIEKKSRFYAHLYQIENLLDVELLLKRHRSLYKKANHHCYAYIYQDKKNNLNERYHDDGEVGHPGKILLNLLKLHMLHNHVIIVSRIYGGINLGIGGVSKSFKTVAESTIVYYKKNH